MHGRDSAIVERIASEVGVAFDFAHNSPPLTLPKN
jgi:hypothetical protein